MRGRPLGSQTLVSWHKPETFQQIMHAYSELQKDGWSKPPVRTLLYKLMSISPQLWTKSCYGNLTSFLQEKRDSGELGYGLFADDGSDALQLTESQRVHYVEYYQNLAPLQLSDDGNLYMILVEHAGLVNSLYEMLDGKVGIFSSSGQIRHEHAFSFISRMQKALDELNGKSIKIVGIADYDPAGRNILENHAKWLSDSFGIELIAYGVNREQIIDVGLNPDDDHQIDGWLALYTPQKFVSDMRRICQI